MNIRLGMCVRHVKRGTTYTVEDRAKMQIGYQTVYNSRKFTVSGCIEIPQYLESITLIAYRCEQDDTLWVRPETEFTDGRFVECD